MIEPNPDGSDTLVILGPGEMLAVMRSLPYGCPLETTCGSKWAAIRWKAGEAKPESVKILEKIREAHGDDAP